MGDPRAKPLGQKAYGSIGHLHGSRMGPGDHTVAPGQSAICTQKARDKHDLIVVREKLDGSCTAVAMVGGEILALGRSGYLASTSPYEQHHLFAEWVAANESRFRKVLYDGERICGEWLAQAHGTLYKIKDTDPWVVFDLMRGGERAPYAELVDRLEGHFVQPAFLGDGPMSIADALTVLGRTGYHGATDQAEGAVWRVERKGKVDFLAKYVRPEKVDGCYLPGLAESTTTEPIWNWRPS